MPQLKPMSQCLSSPVASRARPDRACGGFGLGGCVSTSDLAHEAPRRRRATSKREGFGDRIERAAPARSRSALAKSLQHVADAPAPCAPGWPTPRRTRQKSGPIWSSMLRRPLWPASPPPLLHAHLARRAGRSRRGRTITSSGAIL